MRSNVHRQPDCHCRASDPAAGSWPRPTITVLGGFSNQYQNAEIEKPFFESLDEVTDGEITARSDRSTSLA